MKIIISLVSVVFCLILSPVFAQQNPSLSDLNPDHTIHVDALKNAQETQYQQVLENYGYLIAQNPNAVQIRIEQCKFIEKAFYEDGEEYNPKYDEFDQCLNELYAEFPDHPEVITYKAENLYGDSSINFLTLVLPKIRQNQFEWEKHAWKIYQQLGQQFYYQDKHREAIDAFKDAYKHNDTLDLSVMLASCYISVSENENAKKELLEKINKQCSSFELGQKANLLLQVGEAELALKTFQKAQADTTYYPNYKSISESCEKLGKFQEGHSCLVKDMYDNWEQVTKLERLFLYDLRTQPDSAVGTYDKLRTLGYQSDPLGRHRIALFLAKPFAGWNFSHFAGVLILVFTVFFILVIPYIMILPIHYVGMRFQMQGRINRGDIFRWGLKNFWFVVAGYLFIDFLCMMIFDYGYIISLFNDQYEMSDASSTDEIIAKSDVLFTFLFALLAFIMLRKKDAEIFWGSERTKKEVIVNGTLALFGFKFVYAIVSHFTTLYDINIFGFANALDKVELDDISKVIIAVKNYYGPLLAFFMVVIMAPIYEEIIFRGVILSSCEKHLNFIWANVIQSCLFAVIHYNLSLFFFYFSFGMIAGILRNRSMGLASGMIFHSVNNLLAFAYLMTVAK